MISGANIPVQLDKRFVIASDNYTSVFYSISKNFSCFHRIHHWPKPTTDIDAFGSCAFFILGNSQANMVAARRLGGSVPIVGPTAIFLPPFSIVEWEINANLIEWFCFGVDEPMPPDLPTEPMCYQWPSNWWPSNFADIAELVRNQTAGVAIGKIEQVNPTALLGKKILDQDFQKDISIGEVAAGLGCSRADFAKKFKRCYGLNPVEYRTQLRIFEGTRALLNSGMSVMDAALESGFQDLSRFNKQFRRKMKIVPSQAQTHRKKKLEDRR